MFDIVQEKFIKPIKYTFVTKNWAPYGRVNILLAFQANGLKEFRENVLKKLTVLHNIYELNVL